MSNLPVWYTKEMRGKRKPEDIKTEYRFGSKWYTEQAYYRTAISIHMKKLRAEGSEFSANILKCHLDLLPKQLPYLVEILPLEWPLVSAALYNAKNGDSQTLAEGASRLYALFTGIRRKSRLKIDL